MKVVGIGIDIADLERIALAVSRSKKGFLNRVFNLGELEQLDLLTEDQLAKQVALRFTLKESVIKAAGGLKKGMSWHDICTDFNDGKFQVSLAGGFLQWALAHGQSVEVQAVATLRKNMALGSVIISILPEIKHV